MSSLVINHFLLGNRLLLAHIAATFGEKLKDSQRNSRFWLLSANFLVNFALKNPNLQRMFGAIPKMRHPPVLSVGKICVPLPLKVCSETELTIALYRYSAIVNIPINHSSTPIVVLLKHQHSLQIHAYVNLQ